MKTWGSLSILPARLPRSVEPGRPTGRRPWASRSLWVIIAFFMLLCGARGQTIKGTYSFERDPAQVDGLLALLRDDGKATEVLKCFFGETVVYDRRLPDLLVFIDKTQRGKKPPSSVASSEPCRSADPSIHIALLKNGKRKSKLFGQKYVYVMVFVAETPWAKNSVTDRIFKEDVSKKSVDKVDPTGRTERTEETTTDAKPKPPVSVSQSSLEYRQGSGEFFISAVVRSIASVFSGTTVEKAAQAESPQDIKNQPVELLKVGSTADTNLYFGYVKLPVSDNSINRFTVQEDYPESHLRHQATFGNYSPSRVTTSIGIMGTILTKSQQGEDRRVPVNAFLFGHVFLKRPQLPVAHYQNKPWLNNLLRRSSFSLVGGTRLSKSLFDDLFIGGCVGHLFSSFGLMAGVNFWTPLVPDAEGNMRPSGGKRRGSLCLGLTLIF